MSQGLFFKRETQNTRLDPALKTLPYKLATPEGNGEANMEYRRSSRRGKKPKHLYILKQTPNIHYIKRGQSTDYAMLTSGSSGDFSKHPQICRFATVWGLIMKELVARKAQQKNLLKILMDSLGGFGEGKELHEQ